MGNFIFTIFSAMSLSSADVAALRESVRIMCRDAHDEARIRRYDPTDLAAFVRYEVTADLRPDMRQVDRRFEALSREVSTVLAAEFARVRAQK